MVRSSLPTVMLGYDSTPSEVFLDWRDRFVRIAGTGWSGKTELMANIVSQMDAAEVDILVYAHEDDDEDAIDPRELFPGARVDEDVLRVARHAEKLNAYVLTEDNFGRTMNALVESFEDVQYTKLSSNRPEAVLRYSKEHAGALFRPSVFEGIAVDE